MFFSYELSETNLVKCNACAAVYNVTRGHADLIIITAHINSISVLEDFHVSLFT